MGWKEAAERRWAERNAPPAPDLVDVTVTAQMAFARPAEEVWAFVSDPDSSVLTDDNVVRAFTMPGTPVGEVGEVQVTIKRFTPRGSLVGLLHELVEIEPGRRAVSRSLSAEHTHYATTEVHPVDERSCVLRVSFRNPVERGSETTYAEFAQSELNEYVQRVKDVLTT